MSTEQRFALVTGCGRGGIGEALVTEYTHRGIYAVATVLPHEASDHLDDAGITWFTLDVTVEASVLSLKSQIKTLTGGRLDVLVNCAGICYTMTAIDTDVAAVQRMFDVNIFGPMRMVHHFHDMLIRAAGTIVNIGSIGGVVPYVYGASYNATKAALHHWSNTLRVEMAPLGVRVVTVISGEIGTNILKSDAHRKLPEGSYYSPLATKFEAHVKRVPKTTDRFAYAANVVAQSLKASPSVWFWTGSATATVRFMDMFLWRRIWDYLFWMTFDLGKLRDAHQARMKKTE